MGKKLAVALLAATLLVPAGAQALETNDLLALVAMPLAVAAVSEVADVPVNELMDIVTLLNDAAVPPPQFIEVVRYVPVALVVDNDGDDEFVEFVRLRESEGLNGLQLATVIEQRYRTYGITDSEFSVTAPRYVTVIDYRDAFIPTVVRTRVAEAKAHPHGGPPGQLKKERGLQTGAEVVHGTTRDRRVVNDDRKEDRKERAVAKAKRDKPDRGRVKAGKRHDGDHGNSGRGKDGGKGKGKGKG